MTNNEGEAWGGVELDRAEAELRQVLAVRMQRAVPADLVVTTRTEIEKREFKAYGQGWRDRGEHEEQRRRDAAALRSPGASPRRDAGGKILPFPQQTPPQTSTGHSQRTPPPASSPHPHPHPHPHPPTARPHPSDDDL